MFKTAWGNTKKQSPLLVEFKIIINDKEYIKFRAFILVNSWYVFTCFIKGCLFKGLCPNFNPKGSWFGFSYFLSSTLFGFLSFLFWMWFDFLSFLFSMFGFLSFLFLMLFISLPFLFSMLFGFLSFFFSMLFVSLSFLSPTLFGFLLFLSSTLFPEYPSKKNYFLYFQSVNSTYLSERITCDLIVLKLYTHICKAFDISLVWYHLRVSVNSRTVFTILLLCVS